MHSSIKGTASVVSEEDDPSGPSGRGINTKHSKQATSVLKRWLLDHIQNPYLKPAEKTQLALASGLTKKQVQNWFTNIRKVSPHEEF